MLIQSVARALDILCLFSHSHPLLGVSEISRMMNLPKGTVHGLVSTLVSQGFLQQDTLSKKYQLGLKIYELGVILSGVLEINQKASAPAHRIAKRTQLMCRVAIWDGDSMMITYTAYPTRRAAHSQQLGPRVHAYCTGFGKAALAFLDEEEIKAYLSRVKLAPITATTITSKKRLLTELKEARNTGYSIDREEAIPGVGCIGVPIFKRGGSLAGAISLSGPLHRVLGQQRNEFAEELLTTATEISQALGHLPANIETQMI